MQTNEPIILSRDVEAAVIPVGTKVTLQKGEQAYLSQSLGGSYTVIVNGNMFRIEGANADALGIEKAAVAPQKTSGAPATAEQLEKQEEHIRISDADRDGGPNAKHARGMLEL